jgi:hypothetical protein
VAALAGSAARAGIVGALYVCEGTLVREGPGVPRHRRACLQSEMMALAQAAGAAAVL